MKHVGVLALQGAYDKHVQTLNRLGCDNILVKSKLDLQRCQALIIPGGESTSMTQLMRRYNMTAALQSFVKHNPVFGTCAGLILMADDVDDARVDNLHTLSITIRRNAYGRQAESFQANLPLSFDTHVGDFPGIFIRAPKIEKLAPTIEVLAHHQDNPVLIAQGHYLAATFHPELTQDDRVHRYWLDCFSQ